MLTTKLQEIRAAKPAEARGFTLIELLVVVVIIGILVAIAIPLYLNYEHGAENRSAQSDARSAVSVIEQCKADNGGSLPASQSSTGAGADVAFLCSGTTETASVSSGNTLVYTAPHGAVAADPVAGTPAQAATTNYTIAVTNNDTNSTYTYDSATGHLTKTA